MPEWRETVKSKISIIGAGNVGASCAQRLVERGYADIVLVDIVPGLPQGKALDISESGPIIGFDSQIVGTNDYKATAKSDLVIITSGLSRKPGMTRDELLLANMKIISEVTCTVASYSPDCLILMVANPVDPMTQLALQVSEFDRSRVFGLSGVLDGARLASFIAAELQTSVENISTCVLGQHGGSMVVIPHLTTVSGIPLTQLLPAEKIDSLVKRTIDGGAEIVNLLKTGSAFYAPSAAIAQMADAVLLDKKQVMCCATYLQGEYGIKNTVLGVPVKLGRRGIEQIIELDLTPEEKAQLTNSARAVKELVDVMASGKAS
ncbi:MAG: malate dehydrogenase [Chloroflexi bacterium]|nr:malate dehydrogenase [Chloroflexota bacterium]